MPINSASDSSSGHGPVKVPTEGDVSICFNCGELGIFDSPTVIREPTKNERLEIIEDAGGDIVEAQIRLAAIHKEKVLFEK